jgi:DNA mismatch repair protein MutS
MRQYRSIKEQNPNAILLFRMGDFYETFEDDALTASKVLGITLTKRSNGQARDVPLAGFPHHALDTYLPRLIQAGHRVAICEQLEDPKKAAKIVKRGVVEVVTPGVSFRDQLLEPSRANYLACIAWDEHVVGIAFVDASTGEFSVGELLPNEINGVLGTLAAAELVVSSSSKNLVHGLDLQGTVISTVDDWVFGFDFAYETLLRHFGTHSLKGYGIDHFTAGIVAAGAALHYLGDTQKGALPHLKTLRRYDTADHMVLDHQTLRNLELVGTMQSGAREGSLIGILDETVTPMGARLLRNWLIRPLRKLEEIELRLEAVDGFVSSSRQRTKLRDELSQVGDLERIVAKVCLGRALPRDIVNLKLSLLQIPALKNVLADGAADIVVRIRDGLKLCKPVVDDIQDALSDEPPVNLANGGVIRSGYNAELDELRGLASSGRQWVAKMQAEEALRTGIPSLKVGYKKVFGYYLEITNAHKSRVPDDYIRKQTLVNAERYITPALKEYEEKILTADEKIGQLEQELFNQLTMSVAEHAGDLQENARLLANLDVLTCLAEVAERDRFCRPTLDDGLTLDIVDGRHPVVESVLPPGEPFIANSVRLDSTDQQILIITGPNMAGKSVTLRQTGLIVLLAQIGSFVPAKSAQIGLVDKIFTRVGASDNLASGESTFLVEMNETANILNNASRASLILFDEVGRGTSTFDGISIAWSIVEYLHEHQDVAARTLFATHYHELNMLADRLDRVHNARILVQEHEGKVVFLRNLVSGAADHSYGIEVAKLAGLPSAVIGRAREIMQHLEDEKLMVEASSSQHGAAGRVRDTLKNASGPDFDKAAQEDAAMMRTLASELADLDPNTMTPVEALTKLAEFKNRIKK